MVLLTEGLPLVNGNLVEVVGDLRRLSTDDQLDGGVDGLQGSHHVAGVVAVILTNTTASSQVLRQHGANLQCDVLNEQRLVWKERVFRVVYVNLLTLFHPYEVSLLLHPRVNFEVARKRNSFLDIFDDIRNKILVFFA